MKKAFTLVELIVVIIILAILTTVAFLNFKNYPKQTRDIVRLSDITNAEKSLEIYAIGNGVYPEPDNKRTDSKTGYIEGVFGTGVTQFLGDMIEVKDPNTDEYYIYNTIMTKDAYELKAKNAEMSLVEVSNINKDGIYINGKTGYIFKKIRKTWPDKKCTEKDIDVYTNSGELIQTWAGCNSTIGDGMEWGEDDNVNTDWGCYDYNGNLSLTSCVAGSEEMKSTANPKKYFSSFAINSIGTNVYGDSEFNTIWGKLYTQTEALDGACPDGWHLPTEVEIQKLLGNGLGCNDNIEYSGNWSCDNLSWKWQGNYLSNQADNLATLLNLPLPGYYDFLSNSFLTRGYYTAFWLATSGEQVLLSCNNTSLYFTITYPTYGFSARCIKD